MKLQKTAMMIVSAVLALQVTQAQAQNSFWEQASGFLNKQAATPKANTAATSALSSFSNSDVSNALKEALNIGTERVVKQLGSTGGFANDPAVRISLPGVLQRADKALEAMGMGYLADDLETRMNTAAEQAAPKAKKIFVDAIKKMTMEDAKQIMTGADDAATQYLRKTMSPDLMRDMQPIVGNALAEAGAVKAYDQLIGQYGRLPLMPDVKANLNGYVTQKAIDGMFLYVAKEEAAIRANPVERGTVLLQQVFSAVK